jgi:hypothetical protein
MRESEREGGGERDYLNRKCVSLMERRRKGKGVGGEKLKEKMRKEKGKRERKNHKT